MFTLLFAGAGGGIVRGLMGFIKHQFAYKEVPFRLWYSLSIIGLSAFVGLTVTWAIVGSNLNLPLAQEINPALAFIVGYAGGDFIENLYKILIGKDSLFPAESK